MADRERTETGQFMETLTLEGVIEVFDHVDGPVITSSDVADQFDCTTEAARQKLTRLYDRGEVDKRKTGRTVVYWRTDDVASNGGTSESEHREYSPEGAGVGDSTPEPSNATAGDSRPLNETGEDTPTEGLEDVDFPGGREPGECRAAVDAARDYIRENGGASMSEIVIGVMPNHPVGYDAESDVERINDPDKRNRSTWWRKVVKPGLEALPAVEKPPRGASEWEYTGDDAPESGGVYDPTEEF